MAEYILNFHNSSSFALRYFKNLNSKVTLCDTALVSWVLMYFIQDESFWTEKES